MKKNKVLIIAILLLLIAIALMVLPRKAGACEGCPAGEIEVCTTEQACEDKPVYGYTCPTIHWVYFNHVVDVAYEKSNDPHKCHRPSDADLKNVYNMGHTERIRFKYSNSEWKDNIKIQVGVETVCYDVTTCKCVPEDPAPTPEPTPVPGCAFTMYILKGNGTCSLVRNSALGDSKGVLPSRFAQDGKLTDYGQNVCNQCRTTPFKYSGEFTTSCETPCVDCGTGSSYLLLGKHNK